MIFKVHLLNLGLVILLLLAITTGCDWFHRTPIPTATPSAEIPGEVLEARSVTLAYLAVAYPGKVPAKDIPWTARNTTPLGLVGSSSYEFSANNWRMTIRVPVVAPGNVIYEIELDNQEVGFHWTGKLGADYSVLESNLNVAVEALVARDLALLYVREHYADQAPSRDLVWRGERATPEGMVGHESCRFAAEDWNMTIDYDVARPDLVVYAVELRSLNTGFVWRGLVDAQGEILEHR